MGYPSIDFTRLSKGEDVDIRFKDIFLHYRFLKQPHLKPLLLKPPSFQAKTNRLMKKVTTKIGKIASLKGKLTTSFPS